MSLFHSKTVADELIEKLVEAGVERIYGIFGDSLNPVSDAIRRSGKIKWIHVRHEEGAALIDIVTDPNALSLPPHITAKQVKGYAVTMGKLILSGEVDEIAKKVRSNIRHVKEII